MKIQKRDELISSRKDSFVTEEQQEDMFQRLLETSWTIHNAFQETKKKDDLLVGSVITVMVDAGYELIDLSSDGTAHYLRFEDIDGTKERFIFRLKNMSEDMVTAKVLGYLAHVTIGYGSPVQNAAKLWETLKSEIKSSFIDTNEPGAITTDADITSGYIYAQVPLIMNLGVYFGDHYEVKYDVLQKHIHSTIHVLRKYLQGRMQ